MGTQAHVTIHIASFYYSFLKNSRCRIRLFPGRNTALRAGAKQKPRRDPENKDRVRASGSMSRCSGIRFIHAGHAAFQQICVQQGLFHPVDVVGNGVQRDFVFLCNAVHAAILTAIGQGEDQFVDHGDLGKARLALVFPAVAFFRPNSSRVTPIRFR